MMRIFRTPIERVRLGAFGAEIVSSRFLRLPYGREMLITAAGVFMNLLCAFSFAEISHLTQTDFFYILSGANAVTAILNILPMQPLDGGRLLYLLTARFSDPIRAETVCGIVGRTISVMLFLCAAILYAKGLAGLLFVFAAIGLFFCQFPQVSLAKSVVRV